MLHILLFFIKIVLYIVLFIYVVYISINIVLKPSNDRDWNSDQKVLSYAEIQGDMVKVYNIRNFTYASTTEFTESYYDAAFDLQKLKKVWYIVEPFSGIPGSAHTFLSFEFEGDVFVAVSVEIRKEKGESFHPVKGLFNQYEIMYVWGDEKDLIQLRSNHRNDKVFVYPVRADKQKIQELFLDMARRTNDLKDTPEFYNTLTNTCTTNIVYHVNTVSSKKIPLIHTSVVLPESSDMFAYERGLLDTTLSFEEARKRFYINDRALKYANTVDFSVKIRGEE